MKGVREMTRYKTETGVTTKIAQSSRESREIHAIQRPSAGVRSSRTTIFITENRSAADASDGVNDATVTTQQAAAAAAG